MNVLKNWLLNLLVLLLLFSCSDKRNVMGENTDIVPEEVILDYSSFQINYSYEDSTRFFWYNTTSSIGNFRNNNAVTLIKFSNLPNPGFTVSESIVLHLLKARTYPINLDSLEVSIGILRQDWVNVEATWEKLSDEDYWEDDWFEFGNVDIIKETILTFSDNDTVRVELDWNDIEAHYDNFKVNGIAIIPNFENQDQLLEIKSIFSATPPKMSFNYVTENDTILYNRNFHRCRFITSGKPDKDIFADRIMISNIKPTKSFIKFDIHTPLFNLPDGFDLKKLTVNKAELILYARNKHEHYLTDYEMTIAPLLVKSELSEDKLKFFGEDLEYIPPDFPQVYYLSQESLVVNITSIFQAYLSEQRENKGIVIRSLFEDKDFSYVEFHSFNSDNYDKRPYLRVLFTTPPDF